MKRKRTPTLGNWITYWLYTWVVIAVSTIFVMVFVLKPVHSVHRTDQLGTPLSISLTRSPARPTPTSTPTSTPELIGSQTGDWTTYMADNGRSGFNAAETIITPATAPELKLKWTHQAGDAVVSQPVVVNGLIYWGSWDGYEYATTLDNKTVWATYLGQTVAPLCIPPHLGVSSTATIASVNMHGTMTSVDFLGGGNGYFYALNALTGAILWRTFLGSPPGYYLWSSPAFYQGHIYMGESSIGDCPLVPGRVVQLDPVTGTIQHIFNTIPNGCLGGGVWSSPTIDEAAGTVYIAVGNKGPCPTPQLANRDIYSQALLELRASDLSLLQSWHLPKSDRIHDPDFGATPTLFTTSTGVPMVGVANKNGMYYALKRDDLSAPVWRAALSTGHLGHGVISSSAWDGHNLYVGARTVKVNGVLCPESVVALDPDTGNIIWRHCFQRRALIGAIVAVPGLVVLGQAGYVFVLDANSGQTLFSYGHDTPDDYSLFRGWASISHGVLYIGGTDGKLYAFSP